MRSSILASITVLAVIALFALAAQPALAQAKAAPAAKRAPAAQSWTHPKTPWGDPDIQGTWTSDDCIGTPLQRPANLGDRLYYTEQELAERQNRLKTQLQNDLVDTVAANQRVGTGPPGHWGERARRPCKQTSLIVDPPNGQTPALTPEAQAGRGRGGQRGGGGDAIAAAPAPAPQGRGAAGARGGGGANNNVIYNSYED